MLEWLETLPLEVTLVWSENWSLVKGLFFLNRYGTLLGTLFALFFEIATQRLTFKLCRIGVFTQGLVLLLNLTWSETILFMRVYALSKLDRRFGTFLAIFWAGIFTALIVNYARTVVVIEFIEGPPGHVCLAKPIKQGMYLSLPFFLVLGEQTVVMALCIFFGFRSLWSAHNRLLRTFSRDGTYYFIALSAMSIGNVALILAFPGRFQNYLGPLQGAVQSALASRLVLHLRTQAKATLLDSFMVSTLPESHNVTFYVARAKLEAEEERQNFPL
ncbi:hypothetical protein BKA70DRAFT_231487 [Coprinopsis sp. MPI-PUGE-AT-0042]|nr:hypothetical protein BKA70DRAFT_231487 [Coprinopsis sp. MPI-PUGE-AT-0042]